MIRITVFDVGQALSVLLDFGLDRYALIDCGNDDLNGDHPALTQLESLASRPSARILFVMLSHMHWDHIGGLERLYAWSDALHDKIEAFYCNNALQQLLAKGLGEAPAWAKGMMSTKSVAFRYANAVAIAAKFARKVSSEAECCFFVPTDHTKDYPVDLTPPCLVNDDINVSLYAPSGEDLDRLSQLSGDPGEIAANLLKRSLKLRADVNGTSGVVLISYAGRRVLICGDATARNFDDIARRLVDSGELDVDVLCCWHHGGRLGRGDDTAPDSRAWALMGSSRAHEGRTAIASCGAGNAYGHPHKTTLELADKAGFAIHCTGLSRCAASDDPPEGVRRRATLFGPDAAAKLFKKQACCGNVQVSIDPGGKIKVSPSSGHRKRAECCLAGT